MKDLSLVIPTLGRREEVNNLLGTIIKSVPSSISYEVIIIDQNFSDLLDVIVDYYKDKLEIRHYKVNFRGLSKAKNYGSRVIDGEVVCFVDDDAELLPSTIKVALNCINQGLDVVSGRCVDRDGVDSVKKFGKDPCVLSLDNFEDYFIESTMFFRSNIAKKYEYDENMGIGAFYGAEEGYDLVYRMLKDDVKIMFNPEIVFYHPQTVTDHKDPKAVRRVFSYKCGTGFLCKKHNFKKKYNIRFIKVLLYIPYLVIARPKDVRYYIAELLGLLVGRLV